MRDFVEIKADIQLGWFTTFVLSGSIFCLETQGNCFGDLMYMTSYEFKYIHE